MSFFIEISQRKEIMKRFLKNQMSLKPMTAKSEAKNLLKKKRRVRTNCKQCHSLNLPSLNATFVSKNFKVSRQSWIADIFSALYASQHGQRMRTLAPCASESSQLSEKRKLPQLGRGDLSSKETS